MTAKSVAVEDEVIATPGTAPFTGAESGTWTAGPVSYRSYGSLTVGGINVIYEASCTFNFSGASSSGAAVIGSETVTLTAGSTLLQKNESGVLVNGDSATGTYGNELKVQSSGPLKTS